MKLDIKTIPHSEQRYPTVGDYWEEGKVTHVRISAMDDERYEWLVLIHELVEYFLVKLAGIPLSAVDEFDMAWEKKEPRPEGEPGDSTESPYFMAHQTATMVERICAFAFGVLWRDYEKVVLELD